MPPLHLREDPRVKRLAGPRSTFVLLVIACAPAEPPVPAERAVGSRPPEVEVRPAPSAPPTAAAAGPFTCQRDDDCTASCTHGAVNRRYQQSRYPGGEACEDGCTRKGTDAPRCQGGECVAYHLGAPDPLCTRVANQRTEPLVPGPAHRCQRDDECRMSCAFGAIRGDWYGWQDLAAHECRDGCAAKGTRAGCEDGICVARRDGARLRDCELRSIYP